MRLYEVILSCSLLVSVVAANTRNGARLRSEMAEPLPRTGVVGVTEVLKTGGVAELLGRSLKKSDDDSDDDKDDDDDDSNDDNDDSDDDNDDSDDDDSC
ncbi:hypothetical protein JG688_00013145 [Phytophthora aleatoria]|uniref:RxLR effector protein n=1 Tax=Phytophthora aleatoria TaxID=2496075 RepID=A0A8J5M1G7_9STRA|nr:hypothetical protein JG688_00013145 [Phytophthora aleatoria]